MMMKKSIGCLIIIIVTAVNCYPHCGQCELQMAKATRSITKQNPSNAEKNIIELPAPDLKGTVSVEEAIFKRTSVKDFKDKPLTLKEVSQLLWAAGGKTIDGTSGATRSYPSAGGIYPLEIYLVAGEVDGLKAGIYLYRWRDHSVKLEKKVIFAGS